MSGGVAQARRRRPVRRRPEQQHARLQAVAVGLVEEHAVDLRAVRADQNTVQYTKIKIRKISIFQDAKRYNDLPPLSPIQNRGPDGPLA